MSLGGDSWANATTIPDPTGYQSDPTPITTAPVGASNPYYPVWWKFTPTSDMGIRLSLLNSVVTSPDDYPDTIIEVWYGDHEFLVARNDDSYESGDYLSSLRFRARAGVTYYVKVGTYSDDGSSVLDYVLECESAPGMAAPPPNDDWGNALTLTPGVTSGPFSNESASVEVAEMGLPVDAARGMWWKYTATADTQVMFDMAGSGASLIVRAFTGATLGSLTSVGIDTDQLILTVTAGTTYYVRGDVNSFGPPATYQMKLVVTEYGDEPTVGIRGRTQVAEAGYSSTITLPPDLKVNDRVVIFAAGGNYPFTPSGFTRWGFATGQEAQGAVFTKAAVLGDAGQSITISFDGPNPHYVASLATTGEAEFDLLWSQRVGTAGGTLAASSSTNSEYLYRGDLLLGFSFDRNATTAPVFDRGEELDGGVISGGSYTLWGESQPAEVSVPYAMDHPERSGHYMAVVALYRLTYSEPEVIAPFTKEVSNPSSLGDLRTYAWNIARTDGVIEPASNAHVETTWANLAWATPPGPVTLGPAEFSTDRSNSLFDSNTNRTFRATERYSLYGKKALTNAEKVPPFSHLESIAPEGLWDYTWASVDGTAWTGATVVAVLVDMWMRDWNVDDTGGGDVHPPNATYDTVIRKPGSVTWDASNNLAGWDRTIVGDVLYARDKNHPPNGQFELIETVDLTDALEDVNTGQVTWVSYVAGGTGGEPQRPTAISLASNTFEGAARYGTDITVVSDSSGGMKYTIQSPPIIWITRNTDPVELITTTSAVAPNLLWPRSRDDRGIGAALVYPRADGAQVYPFNH